MLANGVKGSIAEYSSICRANSKRLSSTSALEGDAECVEAAID
jgi:hypothetical protein